MKGMYKIDIIDYDPTNYYVTLFFLLRKKDNMKNSGNMTVIIGSDMIYKIRALNE